MRVRAEATTPLSIAANERHQEFIISAKKYQREQKMTNASFAYFCEIDISTWLRVKAMTRGTSSHVMLKLSLATGIPA